jgi:MOSC domain-containing protein YiiM
MDGPTLGRDATVPRLISVNVGRPKIVDTGNREVSTAIWKRPVEGRVQVRGVNLAGDEQADLTVHGGPDKAVYAYALEETGKWEAELGRELGVGAFGENLTTTGVDVSGAVIGELWRVGTTLLEVVQPRFPCFKLGLRMEDPGFVRRFAHGSRPGAYLRIVEEGELGRGDEVSVEARPDHGVTSRLVYDAVLVDRSLVPRALQAPDLIPSLVEALGGRSTTSPPNRR